MSEQESEYVYILKYVWNDIDIIGVYKTHEKAKEIAELHNSRLTSSRRKLHWKDMDDSLGYFVNNVSIATTSHATCIFFISRYKVQD